MDLGKSLEDYLEAILILSRENGIVRSVDVAHYMNFSKPSVCHAVKELRNKGYLEMNEENFLLLTKNGRMLAERVYDRHCSLKKLFIKIGVRPDLAEKDACLIEHIISEESYQKLKGIIND